MLLKEKMPSVRTVGRNGKSLKKKLSVVDTSRYLGLG